MLARTERRFHLKPKRLAADTAYGTGRFLGWLVGCGIAPRIPVRDAGERDDGTFSRDDFRWDKRRGVYICPNNKTLHTTGTVHDGNALRYRASKFDCDICALKMQCCPNTPARQIPRDVHEDTRDLARRIMGTKRFLKSRDERKRVEMRFAHLKIHHGFERMRLRGLSGARDEFHLAAIVQNLKTSGVARLQTSRPPTIHRIRPTENVTYRRLIVDMAAKGRLPTIYSWRQCVEAGGLMSYGIDLSDLGHRIADLVDQILKGAKPGEIPIFQPTQFELSINLKTAKTLGIELPPLLVARADKVIE